MTSQAPHVYRTVISLVSGIPESQIRVKTHDIGGGFGGKVPVYPGYVLRDRREPDAGPAGQVDRGPLARTSRRTRSPATTTSTPRWACTNDGTIAGLRVKTLADHGYSDAAADPSKFPAGLFNVITGSYDMPQAFVEVDAAYTNKPPGGVAYRCSFRVTEAVHTIERLVDEAARADRHGPGRVPPQELHPQGPVPVPHARRAGTTTRATTTRRCARRWT